MSGEGETGVQGRLGTPGTGYYQDQKRAKVRRPKRRREDLWEPGEMRAKS
jgi:hypothetical protein